jgi:hypothetical protein
MEKPKVERQKVAAESKFVHVHVRSTVGKHGRLALMNEAVHGATFG